MTTQHIFDRIRAIDTDTHITEPRDVWTARVSTKYLGRFRVDAMRVLSSDSEHLSNLDLLLL